MRSTHLRTAAAVTLAATLALTGCGDDEENENQDGGVEDVQDEDEGDEEGEDEEDD